MNIHLHIERLILDGLPLEQRDGTQVRAAVEAELTRLLSESGLGESYVDDGAFASIRADTIHATDVRPQPLGTQIAHAVYGGIGAPMQNADSQVTQKNG